MKIDMRWIGCISLLIGISLPVMAQHEGEGIFDRYLPIAKLFDSPVFFGIVIGSAILFIIAAVFFLYTVKKMEKQADEWGKDKSEETLIRLLESPVPQEAQLAFIYLRRQGGESLIPLLISRLQELRKEGKGYPHFIYLLEDLKAAAAIPILKTIAAGKSRIAALAQAAIDKITVESKDVITNEKN